MPRQSLRQSLPQQLDDTSLRIARARLENAHQGIDSSSSSSTSDSVPGSDNSSSTTSLFISPPSPISPIWSDSESSATNNTDSTTEPDRQYARLLNAIVALRDEVEYARILEKSDVPMMRAAQLCLLDHFVDYRPHLFRMRLRVSAPIFDRILDQISIHPIFHSNSHNRQLPVAVQLAIFLFRAGHYGNAVALDYVAQWAGVSVGSVVNCTNRVMAAVLDEHDLFVNIPPVDSEDMERARAFTESWTCPAWRKGVFAADGSSIPLFEKPCFFGESFYDRKSRYSLHCQLAIMPHNLLVVDYGLGHPGSVHDAWAFQGTYITSRPAQLIPDGHWMWADSAYPLETWCVVPFKKPKGRRLSRDQNVYNKYLSKVQVRVKHAFAALKGRFQSLHELRMKIQTKKDVKVAV